jgi:hypothetical protein
MQGDPAFGRKSDHDHSRLRTWVSMSDQDRGVIATGRHQRSDDGPWRNLLRTGEEEEVVANPYFRTEFSSDVVVELELHRCRWRWL